MDSLELEELAKAVLCISDEDWEDYNVDLNEQMYDMFGFEDGLIGFEKIVDKLIEFTPIVETALTHTKYHAFVKDNLILARKEIK